jgi:hypothetical protein
MPTPIRKARIRTETRLLGALKRDGERGRERGLADERRLLLPTGGAAATARRPLSATAAANPLPALPPSGYYPPGQPFQPQWSSYGPAGAPRRPRKWLIPACAIAAFLFFLTVLLTHLPEHHSEAWQAGYEAAATNPDETRSVIQGFHRGSAEHFCTWTANSITSVNGLDPKQYYEGCMAGVREKVR